MNIIRGLHNLKPEHRNCAVTIGNFDGVHHGHQALLRLLAVKAREMNVPAALMSFDPLPHEYFARQQPAPRLTSARERYTAIAELDEAIRPDLLLILRFDDALAELSAEAFVSDVLIDALAVKAVVIGDDFRFGKGRRGDIGMLREAGTRHHFTVDALDTLRRVGLAAG